MECRRSPILLWLILLGGNLSRIPQVLRCRVLSAWYSAAVPEILPGLGRGDLSPLYGWLNENIRSKGCLYTPDELIENATGAPLGTAAYKASIKARYLD